MSPLERRGSAASGPAGGRLSVAVVPPFAGRISLRKASPGRRRPCRGSSNSHWMVIPLA